MTYTAVVLTEESQNLLKREMGDRIPDGWNKFCHHMTINLGRASEGPASGCVGMPFVLTVVSVAVDDMALAVGVECVCPSKNKQKHVTVAVNEKKGGKPVMSNYIEDWVPLDDPISLTGIVTEVTE